MRAWLLIVVAVLAPTVLRPVVERRLIYFPDRRLVATPDDVGLPYRDVRFRASDGTLLHGWFVPGDATGALLWLPGNAGSISHRLEMLRRLHDELGVSILVFDYRGYGNSEGRPSERGTYLDTQAALGALEEQPRVTRGRIVYFGQSLGAANAVDLATRRPPSGLILESAFTSIPAMAAVHYPFHPLRPFVRTRYDSLTKIQDVEAPVLGRAAVWGRRLPCRARAPSTRARCRPAHRGRRGPHTTTWTAWPDRLSRSASGLPPPARGHVA